MIKAICGLVALFIVLTTVSGLCCPPRASTVNTAIAVAQLAETYVDCRQTVTNLRRSAGQENNPLVPPVVVRQNRAGHPGACFLAGGLLVGAEYALFRCSSPFYMGVGFIGEAVNIRLNYLVLKGK